VPATGGPSPVGTSLGARRAGARGARRVAVGCRVVRSRRVVPSPVCRARWCWWVPARLSS